MNEQLKNAKQQLELARKMLECNLNDPGLALTLLKYLPEIEQSGLSELCWLLESGQYGCHRNDVIGFFEFFERWLDKEDNADCEPNTA